MRIIQGTKRILKPLVDFPTWMGYRTLVDSGKDVVQGTKQIFTPLEAKRVETFEEAMVRLDLTDSDLNARKKRFLILALLWASASIGVFTYSLLLFSQGSLKGGLLSLSLAFLSFIMSFREHFWYFQVKHRTLGTSFNVWLTSFLRIKK